MSRADATGIVEAEKDELFGFAAELVRCPSVTGEEHAVQDRIARAWRAMGFAVRSFVPRRDRVTSHAAYCDDGLDVERPVVVARVGPESGAPALILNGHADVVPPGDRARWTDDPFSGRITAGRLRGRGACDMKAGLAAITFAARAIATSGLPLRRPVLLQSVPGEETGGLGTLAWILEGETAGAAVIAEPTSLRICPVHSGALTFRVRVPGRATHGATRSRGVSAIDKALLILDALGARERERHQRFSHPMFDPSEPAAPTSVGRMSAGDWPSTVPDLAILEGRHGVFPGEDPAEARRELEDAVAGACARDPFLRDHPARVEWFEGQFEPGETDPESPVVQALSRAHASVHGAAPPIRGVPYGSDLRLFTRHAGIPAVLYGPGDVQLAHAADEWVDLDEVLAAAKTFAALIAEVAA